MPKESIDKLEELIPKLVEEARQLREDNHRLQKELTTFRAELDRTRQDEAKLQNKVKRLGELESVHKKMEKDQTRIRATVKNLLASIEKISPNL